MATQLARIADQLEDLATAASRGKPDPRHAKALLSALGRISHQTGTFKRLLGVGAKKP